jgi:hypothetical protein
MLKALAIKELRESAGIVALAVLGVAYALAELTATPLLPWQSSRLYAYPFVGDRLYFYLAVIAGGFGIALGMKQTAWELGRNTFHFLLHRPLARRHVFYCKLLIGSILVVLVASALVLLYAWWVATPGHVQAPFFWSMTVPAWQFCVAVLPVYLGAFLSGIRPGQWFGSRLLPLAAGILISFGAVITPWWWLGIVISLAGIALLTANILHYVRERDY